MLILPAIDLKGGKCVRLYKGEMDTAKVYSKLPEEVALKWQSQGARMIHVVDLDGAVAGEPRNLGAIARILETVDVPIELGGGIRSREVVDNYLQLGVARVILGTVAHKNGDLVRELCLSYPGRIAVGIDARGGYVAVQGWQEITEKSAMALARELEESGVSHLIYTDIERDGAMMGPNLDATEALAAAVRIPVVLSGGMHTQEDVVRVAGLEDKGVKGVILGRSLYEGTIDLAEAIKKVQKTGDAL
ncbi:MAG TPA: 1-(5-phosphoribosyl)-5-[(5-phosphoribosylamino)methylideneamino]imidazole-4-carboxamide isomerase [Proteobacteria bacterium]|nr:1-(5-phosphoribosyl)-5-[(5-phosphoribosylamino) methylideneamino] imidazole-4-carboxamide isomerase [bacterium BMS3Abin14]HDL53333.1 1-(5-phosphoribosyl)-5-[(5-phosphoribosylamino)methylideneamino]imidazole-4-carboxamide isomerase [Pseudomonadota bacterium]